MNIISGIQRIPRSARTEHRSGFAVQISTNTHTSKRPAITRQKESGPFASITKEAPLQRSNVAAPPFDQTVEDPYDTGQYAPGQFNQQWNGQVVDRGQQLKQRAQDVRNRAAGQHFQKNVRHWWFCKSELIGGAVVIWVAGGLTFFPVMGNSLEYLQSRMPTKTVAVPIASDGTLLGKAQAPSPTTAPQKGQ